MPLHLRLVGHGQALVALVLGIPVAARVVLVPVDDGRARRATRVGGRRGGGGRRRPPRSAIPALRRAVREDGLDLCLGACLLPPMDRRKAEHRANAASSSPRQAPRPQATPPGDRRVSKERSAPSSSRTRTNDTPARPAAVVQEPCMPPPPRAVHSSGDAAHRGSLRRLLVVRVAHRGDAAASRAPRPVETMMGRPVVDARRGRCPLTYGADAAERLQRISLSRACGRDVSSLDRGVQQGVASRV